jgi:zinc D-Ala-D-Ala dipeptidase
MTSTWRTLVVLAFAAAACAGALAQAADDPLKGSTQLVLVLTDDWNAVNGSLRRFERASPLAAWAPIGDRVAVVVGRSGLAWGRGLAATAGDGPVKKEGDGRSPAGAFALSFAFGAASERPSSWAMPYRALGGDLECVDDVASAAYNEVTTRREAVAASWTSSEKMWQEPLYKWGVVVEHNHPAPVAGGGSCIFLHIWKGPAKGTAGCTAMDEGALTAAMAWLRPQSLPRLVQLPKSEYERLKATWSLPPL